MFDENKDCIAGQENAVGAKGTQMPESEQGRVVRASIDPGICGFSGSIRASQKGKRLVELQIESECKNIRRLAASLQEITLQELFLTLSRHPVFVAAEKAKCHPSCPYPVALIKATEVVLSVALPKTVNICFEL
jgi:hypothetical protein